MRRSDLSERLAALAADVDELVELVEVEELKLRLDYGDKVDLIISLQDQIAAEGERLGMGSVIRHTRRLPEPIESLLQQLYAARGEPPRQWWSPEWRCLCGHAYTLWLIPEVEGQDYRIHCEGCLNYIGSESEDEMCATIAREQGRDLYLDELKKIRFQSYMFRKSLYDALHIHENDLPLYISRFDPRPIPELLAAIQHQLDSKRRESDKTNPISDRDIIMLSRHDPQRARRLVAEHRARSQTTREANASKGAFEEPPPARGMTVDDLLDKYEAEQRLAARGADSNVADGS